MKQNKYSITPAGYRVIVLPDPVEETSAGGIVVVQDEKSARSGQVFGTLVAVGPLAWKAFKPDTPWAQVGDRVMYSKYAGKIIVCKRTAERLVLLNDEDIVALVEDEVEDDLDDGEVTA